MWFDLLAQFFPARSGYRPEKMKAELLKPGPVGIALWPLWQIVVVSAIPLAAAYLLAFVLGQGYLVIFLSLGLAFTIAVWFLYFAQRRDDSKLPIVFGASLFLPVVTAYVGEVSSVYKPIDPASSNTGIATMFLMMMFVIGQSFVAGLSLRRYLHIRRFRRESAEIMRSPDPIAKAKSMTENIKLVQARRYLILGSVGFVVLVSGPVEMFIFASGDFMTRISDAFMGSGTYLVFDLAWLGYWAMQYRKLKAAQQHEE